MGGGGAFAIDPTSLIECTTGNTNVADNIINVRRPGNNLIISPDNFVGNASNSWNVINILDEIRLTSNGKTIETIYGETIPSEVLKMPEGLRKFYQKGMVGYRRGDSVGAYSSELLSDNSPWDPTACMRDGYGRLMTSASNPTSTFGMIDFNNRVQTAILKNQHAEFIVPVPLSSLKSLPKNYQTRFVQDLELEVKMKELGRGFNEYTDLLSSDKFHKVELVLIYHNWHDNIENTIRNSNYKKGVPASIYSTNWVRAGTGKAVTDSASTFEIPLTSRNLVTEILLVAKQLSIGSDGGNLEALTKRKSDYTTLTETFSANYKVKFKGSGKTLWDSDNLLLNGPDTADYDLTDRRLVGGDMGYGGRAIDSYTQVENDAKNYGFLFEAVGNARQDGHNITQGGVEYGFGDNMCTLRFGMQTTDEYYTGGVALQTISNPTIEIQHGSRWLDREMEVVVYVKHANMVRIDSDTGEITRTLDV
jgi:hypothetical protein